MYTSFYEFDFSFFQPVRDALTGFATCNFQWSVNYCGGGGHIRCLSHAGYFWFSAAGQDSLVCPENFYPFG